MSLVNQQIANLGGSVEHHWVADEVYSKRMLVPAGMSIGKHVHNYDHASALIKGDVRLSIDGMESVVSGPRMLFIQAGKEHVITAITDTVWHCIHIDDGQDPENIDQILINKGSV